MARPPAPSQPPQQPAPQIIYVQAPPPAPPPKRRSGCTIILGLLGVLLVLGFIGNLLNPTRPKSLVFVTPTPHYNSASTAPTTAPVPVETPILIQGSGIMKTPPFFLSGGAYSVAWTAKATSSTGCFHGGAISAVDPSVFFYEPIGDKMVQNSLAGTTALYNVKAGQYYLNMSSGCDWTVRIAR